MKPRFFFFALKCNWTSTHQELLDLPPCSSVLLPFPVRKMDYLISESALEARGRCGVQSKPPWCKWTCRVNKMRRRWAGPALSQFKFRSLTLQRKLSLLCADCSVEAQHVHLVNNLDFCWIYPNLAVLIGSGAALQDSRLIGLKCVGSTMHTQDGWQ